MVGSRLAVRRGWDFPGSAELVCSSFCTAVCWWCSVPSAGLAAPVPAASPPLCLHPPERCNHPALGLFHAPPSREGSQSQPGTLGTERVLERAGPRGAQEVFLHSLNVPFPKGMSWGGAAARVPSESQPSLGQGLRQALGSQLGQRCRSGMLCPGHLALFAKVVTLVRVLQARSGGHGEGADPE